MRDTQSRKWQITINNPLDHDMQHDAIKEIMKEFASAVYWCMCDEIGKEGTYHTHLYFVCRGGVNFSTVKKRFEGAHIQMANGTSQQNLDYIRKEGRWLNDKKRGTNLPDTFEQWGEMPLERQGQRNDLVDLFDDIKDGKSNYELLEENPALMMNLDKIERARQVIRENQFKSTWRDLEVTYLWGPSRSGKTRIIMELYGYENVYRVTDYQHPFDTYASQEVLVFEEFRSSLRIGEMLNYLDGYPVSLPARYLNKTACFTKVYLISNIPLDEQYKEIQQQSLPTWLAFKRRISEVIEKRNIEGEFTQLKLEMENGDDIPF